MNNSPILTQSEEIEFEKIKCETVVFPPPPKKKEMRNQDKNDDDDEVNITP